MIQSILAAMTTDLAAPLTQIEAHADSALGVAVGIGILVIGWYYIQKILNPHDEDDEHEWRKYRD